MSHAAADLQDRIASAVDLRSVVRTMKALAATSIEQYEASVRALTEYYRVVELGLGVCVRQPDAVAFHAEPPPRPSAAGTGAVIFGSDQGLVGQFNEVVADYAMTMIAASANRCRVWAVGERVSDCLAEAGLPVAGSFAVPQSVHGIAPLVGQILLETTMPASPPAVEELHLFYNRTAPGTSYEPFTQRLLPLDQIWRRHLFDLPWPTTIPPEVVNGGAPTLSVLIREHLFVSLFQACAGSLRSENAARLAAMERADRNIEEMIGRLRGTFHRLRQTRIDDELFDVIAGFDALR